MLRDPALVIFDCDGVLVDSERLINRIESQLLSQVGIEASPEAARTRFKGCTVGEVVERIEAETGAPLSPEWLYDWGMHVARGFVSELRPVAGVGDVLDALAARGVSRCVASQSPSARVALALAVTDLGRHFDGRVFTASMVPRSKPHPDLFLHAAACMGVAPARCAVVEDSPSGVRAAVAAGMRVFGYAADEDPEALARAGATATFIAMRELPALLDDAAYLSDEPETICGPVRRAYEAFARGDARPLTELLADDVVCHLPGRHLGGGRVHGRAELVARTTLAAESCDVPPARWLRGVAGFGEWVSSAEHVTASRRGQVLAEDVCVVWRITDGRCRELWLRPADLLSSDRFWGEP